MHKTIITITTYIIRRYIKDFPKERYVIYLENTRKYRLGKLGPLLK